MVLLKYFKVCKQSGDTGISYLPDDNGPLAKEVPSSAIAAANSSVQRNQETGKPHSEYRVYTGKEKAEIVKRAAVYGISATIKYYVKIEPKKTLPSSGVFDWKEQYQQEVQKQKREGKVTLKLQSFLVRREVGHCCWATCWMGTSNRMYEICVVMEWW